MQERLTPPTIAVVIPVFNQLHLTKRCLGSLLEGSRVARTLIVIDNASSDGTPQWLRGFEERARAQGWNVTILTNSVNTGLSRVFNAGIRASQSDFVAILNNDTWLPPGWDEALLSRSLALGADMVAPVLWEQPWPSSQDDEASAEEVQPMLEISNRFSRRNAGKIARGEWGSVLMFFKRTSLERAGLFDERYFLTFEDADLRTTMERAGMSYFTVGDCLIWHHSKGTRGNDARASDHEIEGLRLFQEKWGFDPRPGLQRRERWLRKWRDFKRAKGWF